MRIRSIVDVITNSSSEVFVFKLDDPLYKKVSGITKFSECLDLDSVGRMILNDYSYSWEESFGDEVKPVCDIFSLYNEEPVPINSEEWEKYKDLYKPAIGYALLNIDRDSTECQEIRNIIHEDYIEQKVRPIIKQLIPGKRYSITIMISLNDYIDTSFLWEGKDIIKAKGYDGSDVDVNIEVLLSMAVLGTIKKYEDK